MKNTLHQPDWITASIALLIALSVGLPPRTQATSVSLGFVEPNGFNESNRQAWLEWTAEPDKTYVIQSADDLAAPQAWKSVDVAVRIGGAGPIRWMAPESMRQAKYYRLVLPQASVSSLESGQYDDGTTNTPFLMLSGQCLPTNGWVEVNGEWFAITEADTNGSWLYVVLTSLPAGTPLNGQIIVRDSHSNLVTTLPLDYPYYTGGAPTVEQLQGPPEEPPASPLALAVYASKKGYDYYQAQSSMAAGRKGYDYYQAGGDAAASRHGYIGFRGQPLSFSPGSGAHLSKKGYDYYQARNEMASMGLKRGSSPVAHEFDDDADRYAGKASYGGQTGIGHPNFADAAGVVPATGEVRCEQTDLTLPGRGMDFVWTRTYRSRTGPDSAQGAGWDFSFNVSLTQQPDGTVQLCSGNGRCDTFYPDGTNGWVRDEWFAEVRDLNGDGYPDVLFADTGRWLFHPEGTPLRGKLAQILDRNGNTISLLYDGAARLEGIVDDLGRTNTVAYDTAGLISSITDFSGRTVQYEYDGSGNLTAVISPPVTGTPNGNDFPGGKTNRFTYTSGFADGRLNHNLTSLIDGRGQVQLQLVYSTNNDPAALDFDAVMSTLRGIDKKDIRRGMVIAKPGSIKRVLQVIENDYVGNVTETLYDSQRRPIQVREYTGRANPTLPTTATENRPAGKLRSTDPDYFETRFEWNADSLCTRVVHPRGDSEEMVYQRAFNQNTSRSNRSGFRAHAGDLRVYRQFACCDTDDDGDGLLDELRWTFEYDPRFGSGAVQARHFRKGGIQADLLSDALEASRTTGGGQIKHRPRGWDGTVYGNHRIGRKGWDGTVKGSTKFDDWDGFVTVATNPRGFVSTVAYDSAGNILRRAHFQEQISGAYEEALEDQIQAMTLDFGYNGSGQLTVVTNALDASGSRRVDTLTYYTNGPQAGYLSSIAIDEPGIHLASRYEYDARGNLTRYIDPNTNDWLFTYNQLDQLVQTESPEYGGGAGGTVRNATRYSYDERNNLVIVDEDNRDADGHLGTNAVWRTQFVYDSLNRLSACWRDKNGALSLRGTAVEYDGNDNIIRYRSGEAVNGNDTNAVVVCQYDERNLLWRQTRAPFTTQVSTARWDYDLNGNLWREDCDDSDGVARDTELTYDGFGRCIAVQDAMGNATTFSYDRNSNLTSRRDYGELNDLPGDASNTLLSETTCAYDGLDRCVEQVDSFFDTTTGAPLGSGLSVTRIAFAPCGQCTSIINARGAITRFAYDTVGRLTAVTDAKTNVTSYTYDACGNILSATQTDRSDLGGAAQQFQVTYAYDKLHRLTRDTRSASAMTNQYAYDSRGNLVRHTDPRGNDTCFTYDGLGRCEDSTSYVGPCDANITINTSHVEYDDNDRVIATTDANKNTTTHAYDSLDRRVSTTEADGTVCTLVWSPRSNLVLQQDANGTVISNRFDLLDRCVSRTITPGAGVAATTTFEHFGYDGLSRLVLASNNVSQSLFSHDSMGNRTHVVSDGWSMLSAHDDAGNRISLTYPSDRVVTYTYDLLDQVSSVSSSPNAQQQPTLLASYLYDGPGRLGRITRANNVNSRHQWDGLLNPANAPGDFGFGQISGVTHQRAATSTIIDRRLATYDRNQNRTSRVQVTPFFADGPTTTNLFAYDACDRLTDFIRESGSPDDYARQYVLDANGNRQTASSNGVAGVYTMDPTLPDPADFQMNQYTTTPFGAQLFDANGNLVGLGSPVSAYQYFYDYADRLVQVDDLASGLAETVAAYHYDALGRRVAEVLYPSAPGSPITNRFVYDGANIIEERNALGVVGKSFILDGTRSQDDGDIRSSRLLMHAGGQDYYYLSDDLDNVLALTDAEGSVVERYDYDDFGAPVFLSPDGVALATNASPVGNPYLFQGLQWDARSGLYHGGNGDYLDPQTGTHRKRPGRTTFSNITLKRGVMTFNGGNPWSHGGSKAQDHNSSRSNKSSSRAQDHNSSRSNKSSSKSFTGGGSGHWLTPLPSPCASADRKEEGGRHTPFHNKYVAKVSDFGMSRLACTGSQRVLSSSGTEGGSHGGRGLAHLRSTGVIHRDLAARNILLSSGRVSLIVPVAMDKGLRF